MSPLTVFPLRFLQIYGKTKELVSNRLRLLQVNATFAQVMWLNTSVQMTWGKTTINWTGLWVHSVILH